MFGYVVIGITFFLFGFALMALINTYSK